MNHLCLALLLFHELACQNSDSYSFHQLVLFLALGDPLRNSQLGRLCGRSNYDSQRIYFVVVVVGVQLLCIVVLLSAVQWSKSAICVYISGSSFPIHTLPSPHPTPQVSTEHWAEFPVLYGRFPPAVCFTHVSAPMSTSQFLSLPPTSTRPLSMFSSLFLPWK